MKSLTVSILAFCVVLGLISFEVRQNDLDLEHLGIINSAPANLECNCFEFVRNDLGLDTEHELKTIFDMREVLELEGYEIQKEPQKGDAIVISAGFDNKLFGDSGYAGVVYEVVEKGHSTTVQFRSSQIVSEHVFAQSGCSNVEISNFLPIDTSAKKKKVSYWRKSE